MKNLLVAAACALFAASAGCASHCDDHDGGEVVVRLTDVPAAVRATLERESAGGRVTEVEREVKDGRTVYSADVEINGVTWDVTVAEDGTLLSKERERQGEK